MSQLYYALAARLAALSALLASLPSSLSFFRSARFARRATLSARSASRAAEAASLRAAFSARAWRLASLRARRSSLLSAAESSFLVAVELSAISVFAGAAPHSCDLSGFVRAAAAGFGAASGAGESGSVGFGDESALPRKKDEYSCRFAISRPDLAAMDSVGVLVVGVLAPDVAGEVEDEAMDAAVAAKMLRASAKRIDFLEHACARLTGPRTARPRPCPSQSRPSTSSAPSRAGG